jgi:acetyltransferase-like isoleucine patch superfamily enzyme
VAREEVANFDRTAVLGRILTWPLPLGVGGRVRTAILRLCGFRIGHGTTVAGTFTVTGGRDASANVTIGRDCFVNHGCVLDASAPIEIGDRVSLGQQVLMTTNTHEADAPERRGGALRATPIRVGDGAWVSARAMLLPGVTVGEGAIVAAGAVVTRDVAPHTLVAGVPARPVRDLLGTEPPDDA